MHYSDLDPPQHAARPLHMGSVIVLVWEITNQMPILIKPFLYLIVFGQIGLLFVSVFGHGPSRPQAQPQPPTAARALPSRKRCAARRSAKVLNQARGKALSSYHASLTAASARAI